MEEKKERKMRDSGIPWIGEVPEGWECSRIGGFYSPRMIKVSDMDYQPLSVTMKGIVPQLETAAKTNDHNNRKLVKKGDFAINSRSDRRGSCGISKYDGSVSLINTVLSPNVEMCPQFFDWLFHTAQFSDEFYKWGHGIVDDLWTTGWQDMKKINIPVPPIPEQHRIADFLDSKCSEIDSLIENLRARMESAKEYKKAVITEAVTKGLDKDAKMKDSGVEWIGEIPDGWKVVRFKHIASIKSNLVQPDKYMKYPQIAPDNIEKDTGRLLSHQTVEESGIISGNHLFYRGQILYSKIRPNLNKLTVAPFDGLCSADMYPIESKLPIIFMVYSMLSAYFVSQVSLIIQDRVKMPKINQEELGEIKVVVPSQQEMLTIADYLDSKCSEIDALLQNYEDQIATLEEYKKSLIYEYVTGKKEVPVA